MDDDDEYGNEIEIDYNDMQGLRDNGSLNSS